MQQNAALTAEAVDTSAVMLKLLRRRCEQIATNATSRLTTHQADALAYMATRPSKISETFDLVVTHFFLDCLSQSEVDRLAFDISRRMFPGAIWLVSDFRIPDGIARTPAKLFVRILYFAFRVLTGLRTNRLPDHASALASAGLVRMAESHSLFGILASELWILPVSHLDTSDL